ncbi:hypothetical protein OSC27_08200 [Microbacterium sp. STN6]|uniref:hypothetical protein n=1 Tax=Microbacterium sp. STN6 TaxID=2995588 RepID=UPI00226081A8|nr:hypothetical protein [Microbacterium sp. STN6]MCX7522257.1 hypothetical protein [Microbacterium sp. STN6]
MYNRQRSLSRAAIAARARALRTGAPWTGILLLTGGFHFYRGVPADGVIFVAAGLAVLADSAGLLGAPRSGAVLTGRVAAPVAVVAGLVLVFAPRYSPADAVTLAALGVASLVLVWPEPAGLPTDDGTGVAEQALDTRRSVRRTGVLWSIVGVAGCLWELSAYFLGLPSATAEFAHPPLSDIVGPLLDSVAGRALCVAVWFIGGFALLRRGRSS